MATVFTTKITGCRVTTQDDLTDVVKDVNCDITGTDDVYTKVTFTLPIIVTFGPADPATFTPFSSITQEEMLAWVNAQTEQLAPTQAHIDYVVQRDVQVAQLEPMPLPWAPPTPPAPEGPTEMPTEAPTGYEPNNP